MDSIGIEAGSALVMDIFLNELVLENIAYRDVIDLAEALREGVIRAILDFGSTDQQDRWIQIPIAGPPMVAFPNGKIIVPRCVHTVVSDICLHHPKHS